MTIRLPADIYRSLPELKSPNHTRFKLSGRLYKKKKKKKLSGRWVMGIIKINLFGVFQAQLGKEQFLSLY